MLDGMEPPCPSHFLFTPQVLSTSEYHGKLAAICRQEFDGVDGSQTILEPFGVIGKLSVLCLWYRLITSNHAYNDSIRIKSTLTWTRTLQHLRIRVHLLLHEVLSQGCHSSVQKNFWDLMGKLTSIFLHAIHDDSWVPQPGTFSLSYACCILTVS